VTPNASVSSGQKQATALLVLSRVPAYASKSRNQALNKETRVQKITPSLWFDGQAEEAARFYVSVFKDSRIVRTNYYREGSPGTAGSVLTVQFILDGMEFVAINGGPQFKFTPAISFVANCETQDEVDRLWQALCEGGQEVQCGWLTDKYGVSWQIVPTVLPDMLSSADTAAAQRAFTAMLGMKKLDLSALQRAYENV
jgi:predicted 3-demethylubiquinone-9 3-methyltransferase (glyoxalase superfamily)